MAKGKYTEWITDDGLLRLEAWARDGLVDEQIAHNMGIATGTLYDWKKKYPQISEALKKGKEPVDIEVENALLKRALGYRYKETTREAKYDPASKKYVMVVSKEVEKEVLPDVTAQIYWLKNRMRGKWVDRPVAQDQGTEETGVVVLPPIKEVNGA